MAFFASSLDFDHTRRATAEAETVNEVVAKYAVTIGLVPHEPSGWTPGRGSFGGFTWRCDAGHDADRDPEFRVKIYDAETHDTVGSAWIQKLA